MKPGSKGASLLNMSLRLEFDFYGGVRYSSWEYLCQFFLLHESE